MRRFFFLSGSPRIQKTIVRGKWVPLFVVFCVCNGQFIAHPKFNVGIAIEKLAPAMFCHCYCVLPCFCYKQGCTIAHPKFNVGVAIKKFGPAFFAIYKTLVVLHSLGSTFLKNKKRNLKVLSWFWGSTQFGHDIKIHNSVVWLNCVMFHSKNIIYVKFWV